MALSSTQQANRTRTNLQRPVALRSHNFSPLQPASRRKIAIVLTTDDGNPAEVLATLAACGVTTIARAFDDEAAALISALRPEMTVVMWNAGNASSGARIAAALPREDTGVLLMVDSGESLAGKIAAFELGADASLNAGDDARLVAATINALLRRTPDPEPDLIAAPIQPGQIGALVLDHDTFEVYESGELLRLTPTEFRILAHLAAHSDVSQSHSQIMAAIHDYQFTKFEAQQSIKVYVRRLRAKLASCASPSVEIVNSRSLGYRLQPARA